MFTKASLCAALSFGAGAWAFYKTQSVTKEMFDPVLAACTSKDYATVQDFVEQTGYRAYDANCGFGVLNPLICLTTQFMYELTQYSPAGMLTWGATMLPMLPVSVLVAIEAGRQGNRGLLLYPTFITFLFLALGVSVVFPSLWVPAYCIWGNENGFPSIARARLAFPMALPMVIVSVLLFQLDPRSDLWSLCAGIFSGPMNLTPILLWGVGPPLVMTKEEKVISAETCAFAFGLAGVIALLGWFYLGYTYALEYGMEVDRFWNDIWVEANPVVQFMTIDASILWFGLLLHIASRDLGSALEALIFTPFFGPGAACAMALAAKEMDNAPQLAAAEKQKKNN